LSETAPNIQVISISESLQLAILNLAGFAAERGLSEKRDIEKQAARHLVRTVLDRQDLEIGYEENGRPVLNNGTHISISHSFDLLVILFSRETSEIGVDVEKVREKIMNIITKFLSREELDELTGSSYAKYTLYWAAKEAVYKAAGIPGLLFGEEMLVEPFSYSEQGGELQVQLLRKDAERTFTLRYKIMNDHVLAYTINE
jgi:4'-phosphopantetheinyl transferase